MVASASTLARSRRRVPLESSTNCSRHALRSFLQKPRRVRRYAILTDRRVCSSGPCCRCGRRYRRRSPQGYLRPGPEHRHEAHGEDDADAPRFMLLTSSCSIFTSFPVVRLKCRGILAGHYFGCVRQLLHVPEPRQRHLRFRRHPPLSFRIEVRSALPIDPSFRSRCRCVAAVSPAGGFRSRGGS